MTVQGVYFSPTTYAAIGAVGVPGTGFTGAPNTGVGTMSVWVKGISPLDYTNDSSGGAHTNNQNGLFDILDAANNSSGTFLAGINFEFAGGNTHNYTSFYSSFQLGNSGTELAAYSVGVWMGDGKWHHLLMSWDHNHAGGSRICKYVIDRFYCYTSSQGYTDGGPAFTLDYSTFNYWELFDGFGPTGNCAELWFAPGVFLDVTDPAVYAAFVKSDGTPADLGTTGQNPTGSSPLLYLSARTSAAEFLVNKGSGGRTFTYPSDSSGAISFTSDPVSIEVPLTIISGTQTNLNLQSGYTNITISNFYGGSSFPYNQPLWPLLSGPGEIAVNIDYVDDDVPRFTDADVRVLSSVSTAVLHDDGTDSTSTLNNQYNSPNYWAIGRGTNNIFTVAWDTDTLTMGVSIAPLVPSPTVSFHVIIDPGWMATNISNYSARAPMVVACPIWWAGKEQYVCAFDITPGSGQVIMIDAAGNQTAAKIWGGFTESDTWNAAFGSNPENFIVVTSDPTHTYNYISICGWETGAGSFSIAKSDMSGNELWRKYIHIGDNLEAQLILQEYWFTNHFAGSGTVSTPNGFYIAGSPATSGIHSPNSLLYLPLEGDSYTLYWLYAVSGDTIAEAVTSSFAYPIADNNRLFLFSPSGVAYYDLVPVITPPPSTAVKAYAMILA